MEGGIFVSPTFHPISVEDPCPKKPQDFQKSKTSFFLSLSLRSHSYSYFLPHFKKKFTSSSSNFYKQKLIHKKKKQNQTMFEAQRLMDLQDNPNFGDPKSWLSGDNDNNNINININSSPTHLPTTHSSLAPTPTGSNVDRVLFKDLVEIVPLVQSLIVLSLFLWFSLFLFVFREYWDRKSTEHFHSFIFYGFLIWVLWSRGFPLMGVWKMENLNPKKMEIRSFFKQRLIIGVCGCRLFVYFWFLY